MDAMSLFPPEPALDPVLDPEMIDRWDPLSGNFPGVPRDAGVDRSRSGADRRLAITTDEFKAYRTHVRFCHTLTVSWG